MKTFLRIGLVALAFTAAGQTAWAGPYDGRAADAIVGFYHRHLGREPAPQEVDIHLHGMWAYGSTLRDVERSFLTSPEYLRLHGYAPGAWAYGDPSTSYVPAHTYAPAYGYGYSYPAARYGYAPRYHGGGLSFGYYSGPRASGYSVGVGPFRYANVNVNRGYYGGNRNWNGGVNRVGRRR